MKKFSQFINSKNVSEALSFGMPINKGGFLKGMGMGVMKKLGTNIASMALGKGAEDILAAGKEGDVETGKVVDAKLGCKERSLQLKKQIASAKSRLKTAQNRGDAEEERDYQEILDDLELELQHHESECGKIQSARSMHDVEKAKLAGSRERLAALSRTP